MKINDAIDKYDRETSQYIVAYLDLLGATSKMKADSKAEKLNMNTLYNLYTSSIATAKIIDMEGYKDIIFKIFSDNIIIAKKLSAEPVKKIQDIKCVLNCVSNFQTTSVYDCVGWLVRGGITIGELFIDDVMVWGKALLKAYEIENSIAIYPRIIIDLETIPEIKLCSELEGYLLQDFDNMYFLNYLHIVHFGGEYLMAGFDLMKNEIGEKCSEHVKQKLYWHMNYVNRELEKKHERGQKKYRLCFD